MTEKYLVLFDYDGVIVDSFDFFVTDFTRACQDYGFNQISSSQDVMNLFEDNVYKRMLELGISLASIDLILEKFILYTELHMDDLVIFEGMKNALEIISKANKVMIITSNISSGPLSVLKRHKVNFFEEILGADKEKSKIKKIQMAMANNTGLTTYYVGDTKGDMLEGKLAGATTIGVSWGWHTVDKLLEGNADFIVTSPRELALLLCPSNEEKHQI